LIWLVLIVLAFPGTGSFALGAAPQLGQTIETGEYLLVIPEGLDPQAPHPVIVAFSPSANGRQLVEEWRNLAAKHRCLLLASKLVRNDMDPSPLLKRIRSKLQGFAQTYGADPGRVVAVGVSGGGMTAHLFAFQYPDTVAAVISCVGYIHEKTLTQKDRYPRGKTAVFLTGPTDFNYKLMGEDRKFLQSLGWSVRWIEFPGGHHQAPEDVRDEALTWILGQPPFAATATVDVGSETPSDALPK
jgi:predicted esterase